MRYDLKYKAFGEQAILIEWPTEISEVILDDILSFKAKIKSQSFKITDIVNGYNTLTLIFNAKIDNILELVNTLKVLYKQPNTNNKTVSFTWQIPVCYDVSFGSDLKTLSKTKNMSIPEIIKRHSNAIYSVYFIGFLPGFLYLGGLDKALHTPRKATPRLDVFKGAVAIGGEQTGIYPNDSAGGWHIIGKTPISFFDVSKQEPCFAKSGDKIQFLSISKHEYSQIEASIEAQPFKLKPKLDA